MTFVCVEFPVLGLPLFPFASPVPASPFSVDALLHTPQSVIYRDMCVSHATLPESIMALRAR